MMKLFISSNLQNNSVIQDFPFINEHFYLLFACQTVVDL